MIELLNIDCMEFLRSAAYKSFDLAILDTPYGIGEDGSRNASRAKKTNFGAKNTRNTHFEVGRIPSNSQFTFFFLPVIGFHIYKKPYRYKNMISLSLAMWFVAIKWKRIKP